MAISSDLRALIGSLKTTFDQEKIGKESLLNIIDEAELSESIYNSNAIENSTLTLPETEKILLELEVSRNLDLREVFEVKNLARAFGYLKQKAAIEELTIDNILLLHKILMTNINDEIAGRFRQKGEYVRVGSHIAPAPDKLEQMMQQLFITYSSDFERYFLEKISIFHLQLETIHPFNDGNGRVGRLAINWQLNRLGFPQLILRDKEKQTYYDAFGEYRTKKTNKIMDRFLAIALTESLHKRIAYLSGKEIINLTDYAQKKGESKSAILNMAKRQTLPAFREKGVWKIGV